METYESVLLVKSEVFVFKIPPRTTNRGYRAADWNLAEPEWTGRMKLVCKGSDCTLKLEDKNTGELFAKCPIEQYPGIAVEAVTDSSRYFVLRIQDDNGRSAFIGIGFTDRSDSFDLNVALQDHFKRLKNDEEIEKEKEEPKQQLDLKFKEGETIKINMKITKKDGGEVTSRPKSRPAVGSGILPPPPGGVKVVPPPPVAKPKAAETGSSNVDLLMGVAAPPSAPAAAAAASAENWGEFAIT
ncbi:hypothetical protein B566_EDAN014416 [Ephemera danica]|nr:hypothetical protein B566_EDAN014416 [Ephemera danica]